MAGVKQNGASAEAKQQAMAEQLEKLKSTESSIVAELSLAENDLEVSETSHEITGRHITEARKKKRFIGRGNSKYQAKSRRS